MTSALEGEGTGKSAAWLRPIRRAAVEYTYEFIKPAAILSIIAIVLSIFNFYARCTSRRY